jgi:phosphoglycerate-specific signal transduction histidine kinase
MTTEERLYKLEGIVEGVMAVLPERVSALEHRMDLLRQEVKAEIASLRQEMKAEIGGLRQEMEEKFNGLRQEVRAEIGGLRQEMAGLRQEMRAEIGNALNKAMLYFTALAAVLALITFLR